MIDYDHSIPVNFEGPISFIYRKWRRRIYSHFDIKYLQTQNQN